MATWSMELIAFIVFGLVCLAFSNRLQYYFKMTVFVILSFFAATLPIPLMIRRPRDHRNALLPAWCVVKIGNILGVRYELRGLKNVNLNHGSVVMLNHQSCLDLIVLGVLWPVIGRATVVSKKEVQYLGTFGLASWLWGTLFINRNDRSSALNAINKETIAIKEKNAKLLFFPEGTRHQGEFLLSFKKGPFHVAIDAQCHIQPIVISRYQFLDSKQKFFGRGHAIVSILPEINTSGLSKLEIDSLMNDCHSKMQKEFETISDETKAQAHMKYF